jgi:GntR family transcriptional regulator/MocR family aminotransferase
MMRRLRLALDRQPPLADQSVLADFIEQGLLNRHLRRMRRAAAARREALLAAWSAQFGARWPLQAPPSGLSVFLPLPGVAQEQQLLARARAAGLDCAGVHELLHTGRMPFGPAGLVLGFGAVPEGQMAAAVRQLGRAWQGL